MRPREEVAPLLFLLKNSAAGGGIMDIMIAGLQTGCRRLLRRLRAISWWSVGGGFSICAMAGLLVSYAGGYNDSRCIASNHIPAGRYTLAVSAKGLCRDNTGLSPEISCITVSCRLPGSAALSMPTESRPLSRGICPGNLLPEPYATADRKLRHLL